MAYNRESIMDAKFGCLQIIAQAGCDPKLNYGQGRKYLVPPDVSLFMDEIDGPVKINDNVGSAYLAYGCRGPTIIAEFQGVELTMDAYDAQVFAHMFDKMQWR